MDCQLYIQCILLCLLLLSLAEEKAKAMTAHEKLELRDKVKEMFYHGYNNYMEHAYPADELMPLSCRGRYRGTEPSRGDIDDALGNFSLTLVDTLDTLVVLGELEEFEKAVKLVIRDISFDSDIVVSVFETNIRMLGGLLGGHAAAQYLKRRRKGMGWYRDELLDAAKDLGDRLLPAFNTTTGIPYPRVNLRYGVKHEFSRTGHEQDTCTACAGTMILEFSALTRMTGDPIYEAKAHKAMDSLWRSRHRVSDLVGTVINIHSGDWVRRESGIGAGIDSYYEYLLKAYILLGDDTYLDRFNTHYAAVMKYVSQGPMMLDVHMHKPLTTARNFMDAMLAFWPGLQVLKGDIRSAVELHEMLFQVTQRHKFLPEAFTSDFRIHWGQYPLRPEFLESTYFLYEATGDPHYLDVGKEILDKLETHARVRCGYAAIKDVSVGTHADQMDSFVLAETFKYLYMLFSEKEDLVINLDDFVFTTEAHLLPLSLSMMGGSQNITRVELQLSLHEEDDSNFERTCPNTQLDSNYVQNLRNPLKNFVNQACPRTRDGSRTRLRASEFMTGNKDHMDQLQRMGIRIVTMNDGRVQLLHTATEASSPEDAEDGMLFMQEMIELSKTQAQEVQQEPRVVQFMTPPYFGHVVLNAGPAQFGYDLKKHGEVRGRLVIAEPYEGCQPLANAEEARGKIVILERGACMFVDKARHLQAAGAIGGLVVDHNAGTSSEIQPLFAMSGDGKEDVTIPMLFLFHTEGTKLIEALKKFGFLQVFLGYQAKKSEDIMKDLLQDQEERVRIQKANTYKEDEPIPAEESPVEHPSTTSAASTADSSKAPQSLIIDNYYQTVDLGGIQVQLRPKVIPGTDKPGEEIDLKVRVTHQEDANQGPMINVDRETFKREVGSAVEKLAAQLAQRTDFSMADQQKNYVSALGKVLEAMVTENYRLVDKSSMSSVQQLSEELKSSSGGPEESSRVADEGGDGERVASSSPSPEEVVDELTKNINEALDPYINEQLKVVMDEAERGMETNEGDRIVVTEYTDVIRSFATAEELEGLDVEDQQSRAATTGASKNPECPGTEPLELPESSSPGLEYSVHRDNLFAQQDEMPQQVVAPPVDDVEEFEGHIWRVGGAIQDVDTVALEDLASTEDDAQSDARQNTQASQRQNNNDTPSPSQVAEHDVDADLEDGEHLEGTSGDVHRSVNGGGEQGSNAGVRDAPEGPRIDSSTVSQWTVHGDAPHSTSKVSISPAPRGVNRVSPQTDGVAPRSTATSSIDRTSASQLSSDSSSQLHSAQSEPSSRDESRSTYQDPTHQFPQGKQDQTVGESQTVTAGASSAGHEKMAGSPGRSANVEESDVRTLAQGSGDDTQGVSTEPTNFDLDSADSGEL